MTVAELLAQSRAAHMAYRGGDRVDEHFPLALRLRTEAHALDPQHTDPAWDEPGKFHGQHDALLDFYAKQLAR